MMSSERPPAQLLLKIVLETDSHSAPRSVTQWKWNYDVARAPDAGLPRGLIGSPTWTEAGGAPASNVVGTTFN